MQGTETEKNRISENIQTGEAPEPKKQEESPEVPRRNAEDGNTTDRNTA